MGVGFSASAATAESTKEQHLVQNDEADPECCEAIWQHRKKAEEEHLEIGEIESQVHLINQFHFIK